MDTYIKAVSLGPQCLQAPLRQNFEPVGGRQGPFAFLFSFSSGLVRSLPTLLDYLESHPGFGLPSLPLDPFSIILSKA